MEPWTKWLTEWAWWIVPISILMFVGTLALIPVLLIRLPADYFVRRPVADWPTQRPLIHLLGYRQKSVGFNFDHGGRGHVAFTWTGIIDDLAGHHLDGLSG